MRLNIVDDPSQVHDRLNTACELNAPADIRVPRGRMIATYKSRLYEVREDDGERSVAIDIPTEEGHFVTLTRGCQMEVHFAAKSERFMFEAKVVGKSTFRLGDDKKVRVLLISYPRVLENSQRRAYFRVSPPWSQQIVVRMTTFKHKKDGVWTYEERRDALRAQLLNISAGGIAVRVPKNESKDIDVNTRLKLAFRLTSEEQDDHEIQLIGMIRNQRPDLVDRSMKVFGIQFVDIEQLPQGIRHIDRIWRYVAEIQRKELAATRGAT